MKYLENKTVVVPFDFSDFSKAAVDKVLAMADSSTSLHLIHVVVPAPVVVAFDLTVPIPPGVDLDRQQSCSEKLVGLFANENYKRFKQHCMIGDPADEIIKLAKSVRANLIVMPSHGRTGIGRLLIGSVAEHVLRLANCPVLILRGDERQETN